MKILHTADWHLGQTFYEHDRTFEHQQFLNWLIGVLKEHQIDVLIISGDVFDLSNPAASTVKLFYTFLNNAIKTRPDLQIIVTAGNHDSATRLESPKPLLESSNIHIIGTIDRNTDGSIDFDKLVIPIKNKQSEIELWCIAIPFLRMGDYPVIAGTTAPYIDGVTALYEMVYEYALAKKQPGQAILALGHLHTLDAEISEHDKHERPIMGGVEFIPASAFDESIIYVALGHIHKAQRIGNKGNIYYSGSPIPMSFSELNYNHKVIVFEVKDEKLSNIQFLEIPVTTVLLRVPTVSKPLTEVLQELSKLPEAGEDIEHSPYLEVRVLLDGPEPALRHKIESVLDNKHVRLAKIDVKYPNPNGNEEVIAVNNNKLPELKPVDVFNKIFKSRFNTAPPDDLLKMFNQVLQEIDNNQD